MSSQPVKVKVYGLFWLSKRAYLTIQIAGAAVVLVAVVLALLWPRPAAIPGHPLPPIVGTFYLFLDVFPWISLVVLLMAAMETHIILRKFRDEETRQRNLADLVVDEHAKPQAASDPLTPNP